MMLSKLRAWWRRKFHKAPQQPPIPLREYQQKTYEACQVAFRKYDMHAENKFRKQETKK